MTDVNPTYGKWIKELQAEERAHKNFRKQAKRVVERYRKDKEDVAKYNILWANNGVLHAAVLSSTPKPDVTRRYKDPDQLSRDIAEVTERALAYSVDSYDFQNNADLSVDDFLLCALGQVRVRYVPYFEKGQPPKIPVTAQSVDPSLGEMIDGMMGDAPGVPAMKYFHEGKEVSPLMDDPIMGPYILGEPPDIVVYEEVTCEVVSWERFRWQPANTWDNVNWCAIEHYLTKDELVEQFGEEKAGLCPLGYTQDGGKESTAASSEDAKDRARIIEIFDKAKRKLIFLCDGYTAGVLEEVDDPLNLAGFYPFPRPMMLNVLADKCVPMPDYVLYEDQAEELDIVTQRIRHLTKEMKWNGAYDGAFKELKDLTNQKDGEFLPVDGWSERFESGKAPSLESAMIFRPIDKLQQVLVALESQRESIKQTVYEITGLSDILRGSTRASETLGAQQLKQQNASLRLTDKQNEVNRFFRDVYRIKAEVIVEQFQAQTLILMTGMMVTPDMLKVMKSDLLRSYKIDIETDSTASTDQAQEQKNVIDLMTAITNFFAQTQPLIQAGVPPEVIKELVLFAIRRFKGGDQLEQVLEKLSDSTGQPGTQPPAPIQQGNVIANSGSAPINPPMGGAAAPM
jgi:hypothetical protein